MQKRTRASLFERPTFFLANSSTAGENKFLVSKDAIGGLRKNNRYLRSRFRRVTNGITLKTDEKRPVNMAIR